MKATQNSRWSFAQLLLPSPNRLLGSHSQLLTKSLALLSWTLGVRVALGLNLVMQILDFKKSQTNLRSDPNEFKLKTAKEYQAITGQ